AFCVSSLRSDAESPFMTASATSLVAAPTPTVVSSRRAPQPMLRRTHLVMALSPRVRRGGPSGPPAGGSSRGSWREVPSIYRNALTAFLGTRLYDRRKQTQHQRSSRRPV